MTNKLLLESQSETVDMTKAAGHHAVKHDLLISNASALEDKMAGSAV